MSQEEKVETKVVATKVEVSMKKILHYSKTTVNAGADFGKNYVARNLSCMKKWSPDDISKIFNDEGKLKGASNMKKQRKSTLTANNPTAHADMVKNTRKHVIAALKLVFGEEKLGIRNAEKAQFEMDGKQIDLRTRYSKQIR